MTHEERLSKIVDLKYQICELQQDCPHEAESVDGRALCRGCRSDFGWFCSDSPDNVCHYYSWKGEGKQVLSIQSKLIDIPAEKRIGPEAETDDACLFCGNPADRE